MATKANLEIGPSTIFDARPTLVEPTVMHLGRVLEEHSQVLQANGQMELEVRLGVLKPFNAKSFQRVHLPCSSEALLIPKCNDFQYRFEPGLPPEIYAPLMKKLDALRKEQQMECSVSNEQTLDITFEVPNVEQRHKGRSSLRVSHHKVTENEEKRWKVKGPAVLKNRFEVLDLFSGRSEPQKGPSFDLRVALSAEVAVKDMPRSNTHKLLLKREKHRRSYDFKAWRIDFTVVQSMHGNQLEKHLSYEVELELNAQILRKNLEAKMSNKPHQLWELLTDFLNAGRDLAVLAAEPCPLPAPPTLPQLAPDEGRPAYQRELRGMPEPLIGHYLYRLAEGGWKHGKRKVEQAADGDAAAEPAEKR